MIKTIFFYSAILFCFFAPSALAAQTGSRVSTYFNKKEKVSWLYDNSMGLYALGDAKGHAITSFVFDKPANFDRSVAVVQSKALFHLMNRSGRFLTEGYAFILPGTHNTWNAEGDIFTREGQRLYNIEDAPAFVLTDKMERSLRKQSAADLTVISSQYLTFRNTKTGKYGIVDTSGYIVAPVVYDGISKTASNFIIFEQAHQYGVTDLHLHWILPCHQEYHAVDDYRKAVSAASHSYFQVEKIFDSDSSFFLTYPAGNGCTAVGRNGKWGLVDAKTREVVPPVYDSILYFHNGCFLVKKDSAWGAVDSLGHCIFAPEYEQIKPFSEGYFLMKNKTGYSFTEVYSDLEILEEPIPAVEKKVYEFFEVYREVTLPDLPYEKIWQSSEGLFIVFSNNRYGFIDADFKEIIPPQYNHVNHFKNGLACVVLGNSWGIIDKSGQIILPLKYSWIDEVTNGGQTIYITHQNNLAGLADRSGRELCPPKYSNIGYSSIPVKGLIPVSCDRLLGYIDSSGNELIPPVYQEIRQHLTDSLLIVRKDGLWGLIDKKGRIRIPAVNSIMTAFHYMSPYYVVKRAGKFGVVDLYNRLLAPFIYDTIIYDHIVFQHGKAGLLDTRFHELLPCRYDNLIYESNHHFTVYEGIKKGFANNLNGDIIPPGDWDEIRWENTDPETGYYYVRLRKKWGCLDGKGNIRVPIRFEAISPFHHGVAHVVIAPARQAVSPSFDYQYHAYFQFGSFPQPYPEDYLINSAGELLPPVQKKTRPYPIR